MHLNLQKLVGICKSSVSPVYGADTGRDTVELIGDPGCPVKVTLVIIYAKDDTLLAVCHSTVQMHLFLTLSCNCWESDSAHCIITLSATADGFQASRPSLFAHSGVGCATELLHWMEVRQQRSSDPCRVCFSCISVTSVTPVFLSLPASLTIFPVAEINVKDLRLLSGLSPQVDGVSSHKSVSFLHYVHWNSACEHRFG